MTLGEDRDDRGDCYVALAIVRSRAVRETKHSCGAAHTDARYWAKAITAFGRRPRLLSIERMRPAVAGKQASGDEAAGVLLPSNACERMAHSHCMKGVVRSRPGRAFCSRQAQLGLASAMAAVRRVLPLGNSPGPASACGGRLPLPAGTRLAGRPPSGGPAEIVEAVNSRPDGGDLTGRRPAGDMVGRFPRVLADQRSRDAEIDVATLPTYSAPSAAFWPIVTDAPAGRRHAYSVDSCPPL